MMFKKKERYVINRANPHFRVLIITAMLLIMYCGLLSTVSANLAPVANAGSNQKVIVSQTVFFSGSGSSDPDGDPMQYKWLFGDGFGTAWLNTSSTSHSYTFAGNYTVTLNVTDGSLFNADTCWVLVTSSPNNTAPIAVAGPDQDVYLNQWVYFDGTGSSDPDGDPIIWKWDFGDGNYSGWKGNGKSIHHYTVQGNYTVKLTVSDYSFMDNDTLFVNVWGTKSNNNAPVPDAGLDQNVSAGQKTYFDGSGSYDPDGDNLTYNWYFGDSGSTDWKTNCNTSHKYLNSGKYIAKISVTDGFIISNDTCKINVVGSGGNNSAPVANAGSDQNVKVNQTVFFDGSGSSDPDGDPIQYKWDFADGNNSGWMSNSKTIHVYNNAGNYTVKLTVSDSVLSHNDFCIINVSGNVVNNTAPVADAGQDQNVKVSFNVYFNGSGSYDPDNDTLIYNWNFGDGGSSGWQSNCNSSHKYSNPGNYTVTLAVDDGFLTDNDTCYVNATANSAPVANAGSDQNAKVNQTVNFSAAGSYDPDGDPLTYKWDFGDLKFTGWQNKKTTSHSFNKTGIYNVTLWVDDGDKKDSDICIVTVSSGGSGPAPPPPLDSDGDGYEDDIDPFPYDATQWSDIDGDGYGDNIVGTNPDQFPNNPEEWADTDGDGYGNNGDAFPNDATEWTDTDGDKIGDNTDYFPDDPDEWLDTDNDGIGDNSDAFPEDPKEWSDIDGDGHGDFSDEFPNDASEWIDADGDGVGDNSDAFPEDRSEWIDTDGDGVGDNSDAFPKESTQWLDKDGDGYGDNPDGKNPDAFPDSAFEWLDSDGDGVGDNADAYPNDPTRSKIKRVEDSSKPEDYTLILLIFLILVVVVIISSVMVIYRKKIKTTPREDERHQVNDEINADVIESSEEIIDDELSSDDSDEYILKLTDEVLSFEKPSDFEISKKEISNKVDQKYQKGEISIETYNVIKEKMA